MIKVVTKKINYQSSNFRQEVLTKVKQAIEQAGIWEIIQPNDHVLIKPNFCYDEVFPGYTTAPWIVEGLIIALKEKVKKITIIESDTWTTSADKAFNSLGYSRFIKQYQIEWLNLTKSEFTKIIVPDAQGLDKEMEIPKILKGNKLITVPILKTHGNSFFSGAIKNQWGLLKKLRLNYHENINESLADLNKIVKPHFCVMDATISSDGKGPKQGTPRITNFIMASQDNVALDAAAIKIAGIPIEKVPHISMCAKSKTGALSYQSEGDEIPGLNFQYGQKALLTKGDLFLRKPFIKWFFYQTPAFKLLLIMARLNYTLWRFFVGDRRLKKIMKSRYKEQWQNT